MVAKAVERQSPKLAFWLETPSQAAVEIGRIVGYDIMVFDLEHGVLPLEAWERLSLLGKSLGLEVHARVAKADRVDVQYALDFGADAVILPQIRDLAHAREVCEFGKYPPLGSRGIGWSRTMGYAGVSETFFDGENRRTALYPMVETPGALRDVAEIARLATVDGIFIGPSDLSMTRGRGPYRAQPADFKDMESVVAAVHAAGKKWAMPAPGALAFEFAKARGADFVTTCDDLTALRSGLEQGLLVAKGAHRS